MRRLFRILIFLVLPFLLVVLPAVFIYMTIEKEPAVPITKVANADDAARAKALVKRSLKNFLEPRGIVAISASEEDLNGLMAFIAKSIARLDGSVEIGTWGLYTAMTLRIPHNPIGDYINLRVGLDQSKSGLRIYQASVGRIEISGPAALFIMRFILDLTLGDNNGTVFLDSVQSVVFDKKTVTLYSRPLPDLKERLKRIKDRFEGIRDDIALLGDPEEVSIYYAKLIELGNKIQSKQSVSLAYFMGPIFKLAEQRSGANNPSDENQAAILALAMYAGSIRFESLIGSVKTEEMKSQKPQKKLIVLGGRQDLRMHFIISAGIKIVADSGITYAVGEFKELLDSIRGGSGFSFVDLAADRAGTRFAEVATNRSGGARRIQMLLAGQAREDLFFPNVGDLPEHISQSDFERIYGTVENTEYLNLVSKIDHRINQLLIYDATLIEER